MSLDYESAYHCQCSISLDCGVTIVLKSMRQSMTYRGLLEGVPDSNFNRQLMDSVREEGRKLSINRAKPYLILPERRDYFRTPGDMDALGESGGLLSAFRRRKPEWLPVVTCIADFECTSSKNPNMDASSLVIVWFQNEFAIPISEAALKSIKGIDWHAHAVDFEY
jgi:hypothetical protein